MGQGSGFIISEDGYILTNNHVVGEADVITVKLNDGREFKARKIGGDEKSDIAVIKIDADNLPTLPLGDSTELQVGEWVIAIGNPFGLSETLTMFAPGTKVELLIYRNGKEETVNVSIGELSDTIIQEDVSKLPLKLDFTVEDLTEDKRKCYGLQSDEGVLVTNVDSGSRAFEAGIRPGTIIISVNQKKVDSTKDFGEALQASVQTKKVLLLIKEQRYTRFVVLTLE